MKSEKVIVAVNAEKSISKTALAWALSHVAHPGDFITLLVVVKSGKRSFWSFQKFTKDCQTVDGEKLPRRVSQISESCSQMVLELHDRNQVRMQIKVVSGTPTGVVAAEAKNNAASWVILDKNLKHEEKHCLKELQCNIVAMKGSKPMVLRLNLASDDFQTPFNSSPSSPSSDIENLHSHNMKHSTPVSSPEETTRESSIFSSESIASPYLVYERNPLFEAPYKGNYGLFSDQNGYVNLRTRPELSSASDRKNVLYISQNHSISEKPPTLRDQQIAHNLSSLRKAMSLGRTSSNPPPLCSLCKHIAPVFGKPPKQFDYEELFEATDGFSDMNFLAEGGFGKVYRGDLRDGQKVAVKKLACVGSQMDDDFRREVRVLSYAQHRNVVLLIGFCIEDKNRFLVYEYVCNGSLDLHLHGSKRKALNWHSRKKIAIGAARGLRYLHEDCRVGCIVHRDMKPSNILLTHDYEPLVADFGLARLHTEWEMSEERVVGATGYLAPEYFNSGIITEKVDIYAYGLLLLELITGRKTIDFRFKPVQVLANICILLDPCLSCDQFPKLPPEVQVMSHVALLCLQEDPETRPPMSKLIRILEGGDAGIALRLDLNTIGSRSGHLQGLRSSNAPLETRRHSRKLSY